MSPNSEFSDPQRIDILGQISNSLQSLLADTSVSRTGWACLWLADLASLRLLASKPPADIVGLLLAVESKFKLIQKWSQRDRFSRQSSKHTTPSASVPTSPLQQASKAPSHTAEDETQPCPASPTAVNPGALPSTPQKRKRESGDDLPTPKKQRCEASKTLCRHRDGNSCVLTKIQHIVEVAHLYPFSLNAADAPSGLEFWTALSQFWPPDRVQKWRGAVFGTETGTENVHNLISFSPDAHRLHTKAFFALESNDESLSTDKKSLTLRFYWLKKSETNVPANVLVRPELPDDLDPRTLNVGLFNVDTSTALLSGSRVVLNTEDPETAPLPHVHLIELQWMLNRVAALSAAAEPKDLSDGESDDDDDDDWGVAVRTSSPRESDSSFTSASASSPFDPFMKLPRRGEGA